MVNNAGYLTFPKKKKKDRGELWKPKIENSFPDTDMPCMSSKYARIGGLFIIYADRAPTK